MLLKIILTTYILLIANIFLGAATISNKFIQKILKGMAAVLFTILVILVIISVWV